MIGNISILVFLSVTAGLGCVLLLISAGKLTKQDQLRRRLGRLQPSGDARMSVGDEREDSGQLGQLLADSGLDWDVATFITRALLAATGGLFVGVILGSGPVAFVFAIFGASAMLMFVRHARERRLRQCDDQMPQALEIMALALRAGHALPKALALAADEAPHPIAEELQRASDEHALGRPIAEVVQHLGDRLPGCEAVNTFVIAVLVLQETGGNLIQIIDRIVENARIATTYRGRLQALTAEGRMSAKLLAALPIGFAFIAAAADDSYAAFLLEDPTGKLLGAFAFCWWMAGILWTRRMVKSLV